VVDGPVPVRFHDPAGEPDALVVFLHGGGWVVGGGDAYDPVAARLAAETGARVAAVDYRLAPEHPFPAALDDALAATRQLLGEVDHRAWALVGDSAGANLAAGVALALRDEDVRPAGSLLYYPPTDFEARYPSLAENAEGYWLTGRDIKACSRLYLDGYDPRGDARVSPLRASSLAGLAPTIVATAGFDPLRDAGAAFAEALAAAGSPVRLREHPTLAHGFLGFTADVPAADAAVAALHAELAALLRNG
jgi:acetyl esterase